MRLLTMKRNNVDIQPKKRDIIEDYSNFGSRVYAPKARDGENLVKSMDFSLHTEQLTTFEGIKNLESKIPSSEFYEIPELPKKEAKNLNKTLVF